MKIVHTFWIDEGKDPYNDSFGWCNAQYHVMSWALSCLQLHQFYDNIELITDHKGKDLLIDQLKLPYKKVRTSLEGLQFNDVPSLWVTKKIYSYTLHEEPFLNVDGDVYIFKPFPDNLFSGQLIAQNIEQGFDYYKELVQLVQNTFDFMPSFFSPSFNQDKTLNGSNAGVIGGQHFSFFKLYFEKVRDFTDLNKTKINQLPEALISNFNAVVEQFIFYRLSQELEIPIQYYLPPSLDPAFDGYADFHYLPKNCPYIHAMGSFKKNGWVCEQMAHRLRVDYPEYYYRILSLLESKAIGEKENQAQELAFYSQPHKSSYSIKYNIKSEDEKFQRTWQLASLVLNPENNSMNASEISILQALELMEMEPDNRSTAVLKDVFDFEKEKLRLIQSMPADPIIFENEQNAIDNANLVFVDDQWKEKTVLKLSPMAMTIESQWDWSMNHVLFTKIKGNDVLSNLNLEPYYYLTLLLPDKHHGKVIEYLMNPMETYVFSLLSKESYVSFSEILLQADRFFENVNKQKLLVYLEEAIRFLAYSGVLLLKVNKRDLKTYENIQSR
ncbi:MAG: DUF6734 family protein [Cecembia sp.]